MGEKMLTRELFDAIKSDDTARISYLLEEGGESPNQSLELVGREYTPLAWAANSNIVSDIQRRMETIQLLLEKGADPTIGAPLVECRSVELITLLVYSGSLPDQRIPPPHPNQLTPLICRVLELNRDAAAFLMMNGANVLTKLPDGRPISVALLGCIYKNPSNEDLAISILEDLTKSGGDIDALDSNGICALSMSVSMRYPPSGSFQNTISAILRLGADIQNKDNNGVNPLTHAVKNIDNRALNLNTISKLLAHGADLYIDDFDYQGRTSLWEAVYLRETPATFSGESVNLIKLLLVRGASPNIRDNHGATALLRLVEYLCPLKSSLSPYPPPMPGTPFRLPALEIIKILLQNGADKKIKNNDQRDATYFARAAGTKGQDVLNILNTFN